MPRWVSLSLPAHRDVAMGGLDYAIYLYTKNQSNKYSSIPSSILTSDQLCARPSATVTWDAAFYDTASWVA